jgi:quercetin dioxygenase-like cupin family protein
MKRSDFLLALLSVLPSFTYSKSWPGSPVVKGFKVKAGEARLGKSYKMKGVTLNLLDSKIASADSNGSIAVFEQNGFTPFGGPPLHIHIDQDEYFYIINGEYLFQVGEEKFQMKPGDTIFLPKNVPHAFIQLTEKGKVLVSYFPAGKMEDFFRTTDSWTAPPPTETIAKTFKDHGMLVVGPPLKAE